jgi:large subunit ribosomal protein L1
MAKLTKKQKAVTVDTVKLHAIDEAIALARSGATAW